MIVVRTDRFEKWLDSLADKVARARICARLDRLAHGHRGDCKPVGEGVHEMRIDVGPGYRLYFFQDDATVVVILCGGDKGSQYRDIKSAIKWANELRG